MVKSARPIVGLIVFLLALAILIFVAAPIQLSLGMYGVAITELMLAAFALFSALLLRQPLKLVFPVKRPQLRRVLGTVFFWAGSYLVVTFVTLALFLLFPEQVGNVSSNLSDIFSSVPYPLTVLIAAILPAVCEEALCRGVIQYNLAASGRKWLTVSITALLFGIFHLDLYRFLPTAVLGAALAYLRWETGSILPPILFHLINNLLSTFASTASPAPAEMEVLPATLTAYLIILSAAPMLLWLGAVLIKPRDVARLPFIAPLAVAVGMFLLGTVLTFILSL